jgi:hypothetical protein
VVEGVKWREKDEEGKNISKKEEEKVEVKRGDKR